MRIPDAVRVEIIQKVFQIADTEGYMTNNRVENTRFMDNLVANAEVGGKLLQFMEEEKVRTYIKDGILNQYTKQKRNISDEKLQSAISRFYGEECQALGQGSDVLVYRMMSSQRTLVVAKGTCVKWETALRKILLYIGASPLFHHEDVAKMLVILTGGMPLPANDEVILQRSLSQIGVDVLAV